MFFKKVACFTDIHFGLKGNSRVHNDDCEAFVYWFIEQAKQHGCETAIFLGDWHHHRSATNVSTMNYTVSNMERLGKAFEQVYVIMGNHDLYYRDKRDIQSTVWAKHIPNLHIMNDFYQEGDVSFAPWLVGDDHKKIPKISTKYMFGHFELPHFYMNAMVQMPETGEIKREHFSGIETVFTGHFHKRQQHKNIIYTGNCFPHNYADAGDDDRGMMILEWGKQPQYIAWPNQPRYRVYKLSEILNKEEQLLKPGMHCRINIDINISYEEANFIRETFVEKYKLRELTLIPMKEEHYDEGETAKLEFESIDTIVTNNITAISSEQYDPKLLLDIYRNL